MQIHRLKGYIQNIYLVEYDHGLLLLDGCSKADVNKVCDYISHQLKRPLSDLTSLVVTHMHPDHAGGAHRLRERTGCKVYAHPKAARWYSGIAGRLAHIIDISLALWVAGRLGQPKKGIWYDAVLRPDAVLKDMDPVPNFPEWRALHTPGHTDHDLSLLHENSQQVYVADLIVRVKNQYVPPYPVCHPNQYKRSLARIAELTHPTIFFAHAAPAELAPQTFETIMQLAPHEPKNHWRSMKSRIHRVLRLPLS
ncbi:MBL fold metallo-hydrolase [Alteromonas facilis]|uniref:MBL fold metallo-hydrolase n=1 Tax=Alteromonas facilis TaxID=2048004 RepID=UPI000C28BE08|nr:MBL fold metallo-hydrolase [Alteromonas facilis]